MFIYLVVFAAGLIVGWNFLEQPELVKNWIASLRAKFTR
jgi:hypothetical protein